MAYVIKIYMNAYAKKAFLGTIVVIKNANSIAMNQKEEEFAQMASALAENNFMENFVSN